MPSTTYRTTSAYPMLNRFAGRGGAGNLAKVDPRPATPTRDSTAASFARGILPAIRSNSTSSASSTSSSASSHSSPSDGPAAKAFASTGRGGSGNMARRSSADDPSSLLTSAAAAKRAAAAKKRAEQHVRERPMFSFDEELERQRRVLQHAAPVYHYFGRGGAGNRAPAPDPTTAGGAVGGRSSVGAMPVRRASESSVCSNQGQDDGWSRWQEAETR